MIQIRIFKTRYVDHTRCGERLWKTGDVSCRIRRFYNDDFFIIDNKKVWYSTFRNKSKKFNMYIIAVGNKLEGRPMDGDL